MPIITAWGQNSSITNRMVPDRERPSATLISNEYSRDDVAFVHVTLTQVEVVAFENGIASGGVWYPDEEPETTTPFTCQAPPPMGGAENDAYDSSTFYEFAVEWTDDRFR